MASSRTAWSSFRQRNAPQLVIALALVFCSFVACTARPTVTDTTPEGTSEDFNEPAEPESRGWTVGEPTGDDDLRSRLPDGAIVHTEPLDDDREVSQMFVDHYYFGVPIVTGNIPPNIEDPDFYTFWRPFDQSQPHFEVVAPVPGLGETHAFHCANRRFYRVAKDLWYSCSGQTLYYRMDEDGELVNNRVNAWFQRIVALDVGTETEPFTFTVVTRDRTVSTPRVFKIVKIRGKYPVLARPGGD